MSHTRVSRSRKWDWAVVITLPVVATFITAYFHTSFLLSIVLYFIVPAMYLVFRNKRFLKKALLFTSVSIPFMIIADYFATRDGSWLNSSIFPFRVLNGFALEDFLWVASWFFYIVLFYEYFIDQSRDGYDAPLNSRYKILLIGW